MKITALNFGWQFKFSFATKDITTAFKNEVVNIPHTVKEIDLNYFDDKQTRTVSVYQKVFDYDLKKERRLFVVFEGVMARAAVYFNGNLIANHIGGYTPFKVELTKHLLPKGNMLTVKVDSNEVGDHPPFGKVIDYLTYGGIYREVYLIETGEVAIKHALIDGDGYNFNARIALDYLEKKPRAMEIIVLDEKIKIAEFKSLVNNDFVQIYKVLKTEQWSPTNPKRYLVQIRIDGELLFEKLIGFRLIEVTKDGFYLNGEKIFLRGLNRNQSYPYVGDAMPARAQRLDAQILKNSLGVNIVRSSHYPPSPHFLDECDKLGLMVVTEIPGWQYVGGNDWQGQALTILKEMVIANYNHSSIVIIGSRINESDDNSSFYKQTRKVVKEIDETRPITGVRFFAKSQLLEDVYSYNDFSHNGTNPGLTNKLNITARKNPYLVSEHNGHMFPTKPFDNEGVRLAQALRHLKVLNDGYKMNGLMGVIGWAMHDYNTHKEFGSNDHISYHGVLDINRNDKLAAHIYGSQQNEIPYFEVLSMLHMFEYPGAELNKVFIATNLDKVKVYSNDKMIGEFSKDSKIYKNLPHPPIIIDNLLGSALFERGLMSEYDAIKIGKIIYKALNNERKIGMFDKLAMVTILKRYKIPIHQVGSIITDYVGGWGFDKKVFKFEGYKNGKLIKTIYKGSNDKYALKYKLHHNRLKVGDTYDVTKLDIELVNGFEERAYYNHEIVNIKTSGAISLIGPSEKPLLGGITSAWIRADKKGMGYIEVNSKYGVVKFNIRVF
jgi:beta-galactosidase